MRQLTIDDRPTTATVLGNRRGELALRMHGASRDGQVLRLAGNKCSIGSGEGCTLRIEEAGVRPVHCYILRGAAGTVVRRWSPDTRLNGREFRDALLRQGDRLTLGTVEFEVLEDKDQPAATPGLGEHHEERLQELATEIEHLEQQLRQQTQCFELESSVWSDERQRLEESLHEAAQQQQTAADNFAAATNQLEQHRAEWEAERARLAEEHEKLQQQQEASRHRHDIRDEALALAQGQLDRDRKSLVGREQAIQAEHDAAQRQWKNLTDSLLRAREALEHEKDQWQQRLADRRAELDEQDKALAETRRQLADQARQLDQARGELDAERQAYRVSREQATESLEQREGDLFRREEELQNRHRLLKLRNDELDELHEAVRQQQAQLKGEAAQLTHDRKEFLAWRSECEQEFATRRLELQHQQEAAREESQAVADERQTLTSRKAEVDTAAAELEQQRARLQNEAEELAQAQRQLAAEHDELRQAQQSLQIELSRREADAAEWASAHDVSATHSAERDALNEQQARVDYQLEVYRQRWAELQFAQSEFDRRQQSLTELSDAVARDRDALVAREEAAIEAGQAHGREFAEWEARLAYRQAMLDQQFGELRMQQELIQQQGDHRAVDQGTADSLQSRCVELDAALAQRQEEIELYEDELQLRATQLEQLRSEYEAAQIDWLQREQQLGQQGADEAQAVVEQQRLELEQQRAELQSTRDALMLKEAEWEQERQAWDLQRTRFEQDLREAQQAADQQAEQTRHLEQSLSARQAELEHEIAILQAERVDWQPPHSAIEPESALAVDAAEDPGEAMLALERLRQAALQEVDDETCGDDCDGGVDSAQNEADDEQALISEVEPSEDVSIEDYMSKLMQRVQGRSDASASANAARPKPTPPAKPQVPPSPAVKVPSPPRQPTDKPQTLAPRAAAPEQASSLRAMRELANQSARSALTTSTRRQGVQSGRAKIAVSAATAVCGGILLVMSDGLFAWQTAVAAASFAAAGFFGWQGLKSWRGTTAKNSKQQAAADALPESVEE